MTDRPTQALLLTLLVLAFGPFGAAAAEPALPATALCPFLDLTIPPQIIWSCLPCIIGCVGPPAAAPRPAGASVPQP